MDEAFQHRFSDTQRHAKRVVAEHRECLRQHGQEVEERAGWELPEFALAIENRLIFLQRSMDRLHTAGMEVISALWPGRGAPVGRVALLLENAVARLEVWKASAPRSGAQMALRFVTSWYPGVDLGRLGTMREVPEAERVAREGALVRRPGRAPAGAWRRW